MSVNNRDAVVVDNIKTIDNINNMKHFIATPTYEP